MGFFLVLFYLLILIHFSEGVLKGHGGPNVMSYEGYLGITGLFIERVVKWNLELVGVEEICPFMEISSNLTVVMGNQHNSTGIAQESNKSKERH